MSRSESYSRLTEGNRCRWKRLLGNHFEGKGIMPLEPSKDLLVGGAVHKCLETILGAAIAGREIDRGSVASLIESILVAHQSTVTRMIPSERPTEDGEESRALVETLAHAWARITLPWVMENFDVLDIEKMEKLNLEDPRGDSPVIFRGRADFIARNKASGLLSVHDFKTVSYWDDESAEQWHFNIQQYAMAYLTGQRLGKHVPHYYIHPLLKGNKKYPSPIIKPWVAPAVTPMGQPIFSLRWKKGHDREFAFKHKPIPEFIWDLPDTQLTKFVPVAGPYGSDDEMAQDFLAGAVTENRWWFDALQGWDWKDWSNPTHHAYLVTRIPRSYACWDFKRLCEYHRLCFRRKGWEKPKEFGYQERKFIS